MSVVTLDDYRPHVSRVVRCVGCDHKWTAVYPKYAEIGIRLECPACANISQQIMAKESFSGPLVVLAP